MHRIRGQNLFLFILYFLLSFIKHQNAAGVLSPGLSLAGNTRQGRTLRAVVMVIAETPQTRPVLCCLVPGAALTPSTAVGVQELPGNLPCLWWGFGRHQHSRAGNGPLAAAASVLTLAPCAELESWKDVGTNL